MNRCSPSPLLQVKALTVRYPLNSPSGFTQKRPLTALDNVSFDLQAGEVLGVVGESGCGKSTLARSLMRLVAPSSGSIFFAGMDMMNWPIAGQSVPMQMIFQAPQASLNPRMSAGECIAEPLQVSASRLDKKTIKVRVQRMMEQVGLSVGQMNRYPHEFSGGQCQRIGIARALITEPKLVICDEPVSALDVSIQAQIINLLMDLRRELQLSLLFIAHDLSVVRHISNRVMILYLGKIVELGERDAIYQQPQHPYTQALIQAVPVTDPQLARSQSPPLLEGDLPSPTHLPHGCYFNSRCPWVMERCQTDSPVLHQLVETQTQVACHLLG